MNLNKILISLIIGLILSLGSYLQDLHIETQLLITKYHAETLKLISGKYETRRDVLKSVVKGNKNRILK